MSCKSLFSNSTSCTQHHVLSIPRPRVVRTVRHTNLPFRQMNVFFALFVAGCAAREMLLNDIQIKGSHFSFHIAPSNAIPFLDYTQSDLDVQLAEEGVTALELKFEYTTEDLPVFASKPFDSSSNCPNLSFCMRDIHDYTSKHGKHFPVFVIIESASRENYSTWIWSWLDSMVSSLWQKEDIIKPSDIIGEFDNLREAVHERGWPSLQSCLGKVMFLFRVNAASYAGGGNLNDRIAFPIFSPGEAGDPNAVVFESANSLYNQEQLQDLVRQNFIVITKSDSTFVPDGIDPFSASEVFAFMDTNQDGVASVDDLENLLFGAIGDLHHYLTSIDGLRTAVDSAVYECAGKDATELSKADVACVLNAIKLDLPIAETITSADVRFTAAKKSGAHIILTNHPKPPFKGAPADTYVSVTMDKECNPVTTCECFLESYLALDNCTDSASNSLQMTVGLLLVALMCLLID